MRYFYIVGLGRGAMVDDGRTTYLIRLEKNKIEFISPAGWHINMFLQTLGVKYPEVGGVVDEVYPFPNLAESLKLESYAYDALTSIECLLMDGLSEIHRFRIAVTIEKKLQEDFVYDSVLKSMQEIIADGVAVPTKLFDQPKLTAVCQQ